MKTNLVALRSAALPLLASLALAVPTLADGRNPASLLLFPQFRHDAQPLAGGLPPVNTLITVTNTHPTLPAYVHFVFVDAKGPESTPCSHFNDQTRKLEPCGSISLLTNPFTGVGAREGFAYAFAVDRQAPPWSPVSFNYLIGDLMIVDGINAPGPGLLTNYSISPPGFQAVNSVTNTVIGPAGAAPLPQLNGVMYAKAPARILIPRFMGQDNTTFDSELVLLSLAGESVAPLANSIETLVDFLVFNDNEEAFSAQYAFRCWKRVPLLTINGIFGEEFLGSYTNDAPNEIRLSLTAPTYKEAGWIWLEGNVASSTSADFLDPAIMAFLIEKTAANEVAAEIPFFVGERTGRIVP